MENIVQSISLSLIVGFMIKACLVILTTLSLASLMDRVVTVSVGNWFKMVAWGFFLVSLILTLGIILVV